MISSAATRTLSCLPNVLGASALRTAALDGTGCGPDSDRIGGCGNVRRVVLETEPREVVLARVPTELLCDEDRDGEGNGRPLAAGGVLYPCAG